MPFEICVTQDHWKWQNSIDHIRLEGEIGSSPGPFHKEEHKDVTGILAFTTDLCFHYGNTVWTSVYLLRYIEFQNLGNSPKFRRLSCRSHRTTAPGDIGNICIVGLCELVYASQCTTGCYLTSITPGQTRPRANSLFVLLRLMLWGATSMFASSTKSSAIAERPRDA